MNRKTICSALIVGVIAVLAACATQLSSDDPVLSGTVTSRNGAEAGVWVIAETTDLPTKFAKMVVTDDNGRYVMPDLPRANYQVWVRGYGLVDSPKVSATPGRVLDLTASVAPNEAAAAQYYPSIYWFSMLNVPAKNEFPGTGPNGNGIAPGMLTQNHWLNNIKTNGCLSCHGFGTPGTRTIPKMFAEYPTSMDAWMRRIVSGQAMNNMIAAADRMGTLRSLSLYADWTDRIATGELPFDKPARPQGEIGRAHV